MPQLQINQGPQDALLYDNTRSYFHNVSYVRTSNFQVEYRDVEPQNTAQFGSTVQFVIPKAADLLGPVDLRVQLEPPDLDKTGLSATNDTRMFHQFVDELGFAMIEKATFSVGSNDIETITGEQMQLKNELMTADEQRLGFHSTLKTGRRAFAHLDSRAVTHEPHANDLADIEQKVIRGERPGDSQTMTSKYSAAVAAGAVKPVDVDYTRLIAYGDGTADAQDYPVRVAATGAADLTQPWVSANRQLNIPLNYFFTKHVSNYFPLAAVAGCNDVRIAIKFRRLEELVQVYNARGAIVGAQVLNFPSSWTAIVSGQCSLRCHYVHVTGPEANQLMNMEHVRLLKLYQHVHKDFKNTNKKFDVPIDLSFLHPVSTLIITIRRTGDLTTSTDHANPDAAQKGFFFYHGNGTNPNYDAAMGANGQPRTGAATSTCKLQSIKLTLNGQERHPGLSDGIETDFLQNRLLGMLHSNSNHLQMQQLGTSRRDTLIPIASCTTANAAGVGGFASLDLTNITRATGVPNHITGTIQPGDILAVGPLQVAQVKSVHTITDFATQRIVFADLADINTVVAIPAGAVGDGMSISRKHKLEEDIDRQQMLGMLGSKNIYVYPFSLNPEGSNPSGAVNFSKVSHAKLTLKFDNLNLAAAPTEEDYRVDVYALYYNWLQIKDGRALLSFA